MAALADDEDGAEFQRDHHGGEQEDDGHMVAVTGDYLMQGLVRRGYSPAQAAALVGHMAQESGLNPSDVNQKEGAHGLLQWRLDRWDNLQKYAQAQGKSPEDPDVQMDYIRQEMNGPEAKSGRGFLSATDVNSASAALKPYIRFGDDSDERRRSNAVGFLASYGGAKQPQDPVSPIDPTTTQAPATAAPLSLTAPVGALANLAQAGNAFAGGQPSAAGTAAPTTPGDPSAKAPDFLPLQQIAMGQANPQSLAMAQAIAKSYGFGG